MPKLIIAIDGYSSTGKGTFAKEIASRLGVVYLDSGAMYRAVTLFALQEGIISWNGDIDSRALQRQMLLGGVDISFHRTLKGEDHIYLGDVNVTKRIRQMDVSSNVSSVSALPFVRNHVDNMLHEFGREGCVMDGRDIGTEVFPNADLKIFMTAEASIRAQRRVRQMADAGVAASYEEVLKNVMERDDMDSRRTFHPLRKADDAIVLDNSHMTVEDQIVWLDAILKERFGISIL